MTAYDAALAAIRGHTDDLAADLDVWADRAEPDARARRCASAAVDAIDMALRELHGVRAQLVTEIRVSDNAAAARADELLASRQGWPEERGVSEYNREEFALENPEEPW